MGKVFWKSGALIAPLPPIMVSCGSFEKPNIITIAWTGIINSSPPKTYISVRPERFSYDIIKESKEFIINLVNKDLIKSADLCGVKSGRDIDKFEVCGLQKQECSKVKSPMIGQSPLGLECRVSDVIKLGSHDMFICDIEAVNVQKDLIDESGRMCIEKADLCAFLHGEYFTLGEKIGKLGYTVQKKKK